MKSNTIEFASGLKQLCMQTGVSGYESESGITGYIYNIVKEINKNTFIDKYGNVVSVVGEKRAGIKRIVLEAHMDEFGFEYSKKQAGQSELKTLGHLSRIESVENAKVFVVGSNETGYIKGGQLVFDYETSPQINGTDLLALSFARSFDMASDGTVMATALDNRVGCSVLIELVKFVISRKFNDVQFTFLFSVGEETRTSMWDMGSEFNFGFVIDAAYAQPILFDRCVEKICIPELGNGCAIQYHGDGFVVKNCYIKSLKRIAREASINVQDEIPPGGSGYTNFSSLKNLCGENGVVINIPVRNQHRAASVMNISDVISAVELIQSSIVERIWEA